MTNFNIHEPLLVNLQFLFLNAGLLTIKEKNQTGEISLFSSSQGLAHKLREGIPHCSEIRDTFDVNFKNMMQRSIDEHLIVFTG